MAIRETTAHSVPLDSGLLAFVALLRFLGLPTDAAQLVGATRPFDLTWFIPSIVRFRSLLGEALVGSLFLQLLALIIPLFTQVVIDEVLVHKGWSTLDVLVFGLIVVSVFEVLLRWVIEYVLSPVLRYRSEAGREQ